MLSADAIPTTNLLWITTSHHSMGLTYHFYILVSIKQDISVCLSVSHGTEYPFSSNCHKTLQGSSLKWPLWFSGQTWDTWPLVAHCENPHGSVCKYCLHWYPCMLVDFILSANCNENFSSDEGHWISHVVHDFFLWGHCTWLVFLRYGTLTPLLDLISWNMKVTV